ncbi:MAG: hypothetical protein CMI16_06375 [Opitutaceae bacterium]|nr:hypothetical protein [Opitutaceae bacterium]
MSSDVNVICYCFWGVTNGSGYSAAESVITWCLGAEQIAHVSVVFGTLSHNILVIEPWELSAWVDRKSGVVPIMDKTDPAYTRNPKFEVSLLHLLYVPIEREVALQLQEPLLEASRVYGRGQSYAPDPIVFNGHAYPGLGEMAGDMLARTFRAWSGPAGRDVHSHLILEQEKLQSGGRLQCAQLCVMHLLHVIQLHRALHSSRVIAYDAEHVHELRSVLSARTSLTPRAVYDLFVRIANACTQRKLFAEATADSVGFALSSGRRVADLRSLVIPCPGLKQECLPHRFVS